MIQEQPKFSVIVPMYNTEEYLPSCIESILKQTLSDIEIILVDDGSPDHCGEIADAYARKDLRIRVMHRKNGGLGFARNSGIDAACGEYIGFVDSDDTVEPDMFATLYKCAKDTGAQIVFTGMKIIHMGNVIDTHEHPFGGSALRGPNEIFKLRSAFYGALPEKVPEDPTPVSACLAAYERTFINANSIRFIDIRSEDKFFNTTACRAAKVVAVTHGTPYCYRKDGQPSITKSFSNQTISSFFQMLDALKDMAENEPEEYRPECMMRVRRCVMDYCRVLVRMIEESSISTKEKQSLVAQVLNYHELAAACKGYPFWRLPARQIAFYLCERFRLTKLSMILMKARRYE